MAAEMAGLIPELQPVLSGGGEEQIERLPESQRRRLRGVADRNGSFRQLQDYLVERDFEIHEALVDAVRFQADEFEGEMLMLGFDGPGQGATLIFTLGDAEGVAIGSSLAWVVDEAVYISKDGEVTQLPEATKRMKGVPRLPQESPGKEGAGALFATPVHADHCPCHNQYSECYAWNAICAAAVACCILSGVPVAQLLPVLAQQQQQNVLRLSNVALLVKP